MGPTSESLLALVFLPDPDLVRAVDTFSELILERSRLGARGEDNGFDHCDPEFCQSNAYRHIATCST
jgi:hypothetical protein